MGRKTTYYKKVLKTLESLHAKYPAFGVMRHITTATSDYGDTWGMNDKELLFALQKYEAELDLDKDNVVSEDYLEMIIKDAQDLSDVLKEEDEE